MDFAPLQQRRGRSVCISARFYPLIEFLLLKWIAASIMKRQTDHFEQIGIRCSVASIGR